VKVDVFAWFVGRVTLDHCVIIVMKRACAMVYAIVDTLEYQMYLVPYLVSEGPKYIQVV